MSRMIVVIGNSLPTFEIVLSALMMGGNAVDEDRVITKFFQGMIFLVECVW